MRNLLLVPRFLLVLFAVAALGVVGAPLRTALAHAEPERAVPPINGTVEGSPAKVEIWFSEEVTADGNKIAVTGPDGSSVDLGDTKVDLNDPTHKHVTVSLAPNLPAGVYTVNWVSVSEEDGDADNGRYKFTIAGGTPVASPAASPSASPIASPAASPAATATPGASAGTTTDGERYRWEVFGIGIGAGAIAGLFIYGFWRLVRPKRPVQP
jgi:methionine-rich copper-binding protein CopC